MDAVVAGGQGQVAGGHPDAALGVDGVITGIDVDGSTVDDDVHTALDALGRVRLFRGVLTRRSPAAGGDVQVAAGDDDVGGGVDAVARGGGELHGAAGDGDVARGGVLALVGLQGITSGLHGHGAALDDQSVLATQAVVGGGDVQGAGRHDEVVGGGDAVGPVALDVEGSVTGDGEVGVRVDRGIGVRVLRVGVGVGDSGFAGQGDDHVIGADHVDRRIVGGGDRGVVEDEHDPGVVGGLDGDGLGDVTADPVHAGLGDGAAVVVDGVVLAPVGVVHGGGPGVRGECLVGGRHVDQVGVVRGGGGGGFRGGGGGVVGGGAGGESEDAGHGGGGHAAEKMVTHDVILKQRSRW